MEFLVSLLWCLSLTSLHYELPIWENDFFHEILSQDVLIPHSAALQ